MVDKITTAPTDNTVVNKINEVIDALGTATGANIDLSNLSATGEAHFQAPLISGTNIKTINNTSLLGSGNISVLQNNANGVTGSIAIDDITGGTYYNYSTAYGSLAIAKEYSVAIGNSTQPQGTYCVAIGVNANSLGYGAAIGRISYASNYAVAIGSEAAANTNYSTAIGYASGVAAGANSSIQIGYGTNLTANTFNVGFYNNSNTHYNWQLLDGTTGLIPPDRINAVKDQNSGSVKVWTGTKAQYNAITTKDSNTLYNITDDDTASVYQAYNKAEIDALFAEKCDGQWVGSSLLLANNIAAETTSVDFDLSTYLPNDGHNYEVSLWGNVIAAAGAGNRATLNIATPVYGLRIAECISASNTAARTAGMGIVIVDSTRKLTVNGIAANTGIYYLALVAYRRLGTNV